MKAYFPLPNTNDFDFDRRSTIITTGNQGANIRQRKNAR